MKKNRKNFLFLILKIVLITALLMFANKYIFGFYIVKNNDYKDINIYPHDFLIYYKYNNEYQNNDIVFYNNRIYRIIGTSGQIINKIGNKIMVDNNIIDNINSDYNYPHTILSDELLLLSIKNETKIVSYVKLKDIDGKLIFRMQIRDF